MTQSQAPPWPRGPLLPVRPHGPTLTSPLNHAQGQDHTNCPPSQGQRRLLFPRQCCTTRKAGGGGERLPRASLPGLAPLWVPHPALPPWVPGDGSSCPALDPWGWQLLPSLDPQVIGSSCPAALDPRMTGSSRPALDPRVMGSSCPALDLGAGQLLLCLSPAHRPMLCMHQKEVRHPVRTLLDSGAL